jgi:hypothetical protein
MLIIDPKEKVTAKDFHKLADTVTYAIQREGFPPPMIILSETPYKHWNTIPIKLRYYKPAEDVIDMGFKLAICTDDNINECIANISSKYPDIDVKQYNKDSVKSAEEWGQVSEEWDQV